MDVGGAGGEGMVAIVQGLREADLAVTLLKKGHLINSIQNHQRLAVTRSSVETHTQCTKQDSPAQVCDDRYASSYQLAHCHLRPTSPEQDVTEFPRQRTKPSRTTGNFEMPSRGEMAYQVMPAQTFQRGVTITPSPDDSFSSPHSSHYQTDAFVSSLRRYPFTPDRTASTELVQRLLNYTHDKHLSKNSSGSTRSLVKPRPTIVVTKDKPVGGPSYSNETKKNYTGPTETPTKDHGSHTNDDLRIGNRSKRTLRNFNLDTRYKNDQLNEAYNYLKASYSSRRSYTGRGSEVRYLKDVKRCIRDTIQQLVNNDEQVCPNVQNRYSQHQKKYHADRAEEESSPYRVRNEEMQAGHPYVTKKVSRCRAPAGTHRSCGYKPVPCALSKMIDKGINIADDKPSCCYRPMYTCPCKINKSGDKLEKLIAEWLEELPVYAHDTPENKLKREQMCRELAHKLNNLQGRKSFDDLAKREIKKCVNGLPIWYPGTKHDQEIFKNQLAENLFNKITAEESTDLKNVVEKWLNEIDLRCVDDRRQATNKDKIRDIIVKRLNPIINKPADELKEEVMDILQQLPVKIGSDEFMQEAHSKLADKLVKYIIQMRSGKDKAISADDGELADQIWKFLENATRIPCQIKCKNQDFIEDFARKLNYMRNNNADDNNIEKEIEKFLDALPKKGILIDPLDKPQLIRNIKDQMQYLTNKSRTLDYLAENIWESIEKAIKVPREIKNKNQDYILNFARKLNDMRNDNADDDAIEATIESFLDALPAKGIPISSSDRKQLAKNLIDQEKNMADQSRADSELAQKIWESLENEINVPSDVKKKNQDYIKNFARKLNEMKNSNANSDEIEEEIEKFLDALPKKGIPINLSDKRNLTRNLVDLNNLPNISEEDEKLAQTIWDSLENATKVPSEVKQKNQVYVKQFAQKLNALKKDNASNDDIEKEIEKFVNSLSKKGIVINPSDKKHLVRNIVNQSQFIPKKSRKRWDQNEDQEILIEDEISKLIDDITTNIDEKKRNEIKKRIADILISRVHSLSGNDKLFHEITNDIASILKKYAKMNATDARNMADELMYRIKEIIEPVASVSRRPTITADEVHDIVKNEVGDILHGFYLPVDDIESLENNITDILADQIVRGTDDHTTEEQILNILHDANVSDDNARKIIRRLMEKNKETSLRYKPQKYSVSPKEQQKLEEYERTILEYIHDITGDDMSEIKRKIGKDAAKLAAKVARIMADPNDFDKENSIMHETMQFMQRAPFDIDESRADLADQLRARLQNGDFKTSTPRKKGAKFIPKRDASISAIRFDSKDSTPEIQRRSPSSSEEKIYKNELESIIKSWIDDMNLNLNVEDEKSFKEMMSKDLATDIADRQRYLQLNPNAKVSDKDELEHLKYQVFRWLNKFLDDEVLPSIMRKTKTLMEKIKRVEVPQLRKASTEAVKTKEELKLNKIPEIFQDDQLYEKMIEDGIEDVLTHVSSQNLEAEMPTLKQALVEKVKKARQRSSITPVEDTYNQQLRDAISKTLSLQDLTKDEKAEFEILKQNLADDFVNMNYEGTDKAQKQKYRQKISNEINKFCNDYLKRHPSKTIDTKKINKDLFKALMNVSAPDEESFRNEVELTKLKDEVGDWLKELPLKHQTVEEQLQTQKMASMLSKKLLALEKEKEAFPDRKYSDIARKEIMNFISKLPLTTDNKELMKQYAEDLLNNLKDSEQSRAVSSHSKSDTTIVSEASALPVDESSQTEIGQPSPSICTRPPCPGRLQSSCVQTPCQGICSPADVMPHVIIKEYYWDSVESSMVPICRPPCTSFEIPPPCMPPSHQIPDGSMSGHKLSQTQTSPRRCPYMPSTAPRPCIPSVVPCYPPSNISYECPIRPNPVSPKASVPQSELRSSPSPKIPCYMRRDLPQNSSEDAETTCRSNRSPRVTCLGSYEQMEKVCKNQNVCKIRDYVWDDCEVCDKSRRCIPSHEDFESFVRDRKEENSKCRCKSRVYPKCHGGKSPACEPPSPCCEESMKKCAKCCGMHRHCPYPSHMFFKK